MAEGQNGDREFSLKFRIYPYRGSCLYFLVYVWPDYESAYRNVCSKTKLNKKWEACSVMEEYFSRNRLTHLIGRVHFTEKTSRDYRVVAHECLHATMEWLRRIGMAIPCGYTRTGRVYREEELLCVVQGNLVNSVLKRTMGK